MIAAEDERAVSRDVLFADDVKLIHPSEQAAEPVHELFVKRHFLIS